MRRGFFCSAAWCGVGVLTLFNFSTLLPVHAADVSTEEVSPEAPKRSNTMVKKEIAAVIEAQLAAFRANDYPTAYTFASSEIRQMFGLPEFETMVRTSFPLIDKSQKAVFGLTFDTGDEAVVTVRVENAESSVSYQYHLKKEPTGWRISGVTVATEPGVVI